MQSDICVAPCAASQAAATICPLLSITADSSRVGLSSDLRNGCKSSFPHVRKNCTNKDLKRRAQDTSTG